MTVEKLEKMRRSVRRRRWLCMLLALACLIGLLNPLHPFSAESAADMPAPEIMGWVLTFIVAGVIACMLLALFWWLIADRADKKFRHAFKCQYVMQTIETLPGFRELLYSPYQGFTHDEIRNAAVVNCGDQKEFASEDLLTGICGDVRFRFSDVITKREIRRTRGRRDVQECFSGQVIELERFDDRKVSNGHVQVFQKEFLSDLRGWTAKHRIKTENEEFNRRFQVYAADAHNAYYILTPLMMEKIEAFSRAVGAQVAVTFRGKSVFVAIAGRRSMFDPADHTPVDQQQGRILEDISLLQKAREIIASAVVI